MELSEDDFWARLAIEAGEMKKEQQARNER